MQSPQLVPASVALNLAIIDWGDASAISYSDKVDILRTIASWYYSEPQQIMGYALATMRIWGDIQYYIKEYEK